MKEPISPKDLARPSLWRIGQLEAHLRDARKRPTFAELHVFAGSYGGFEVRSGITVDEAGNEIFAAVVTGTSNEPAIAVAASFASVLGRDGWHLETGPGASTVSKVIRSARGGGGT